MKFLDELLKEFVNGDNVDISRKVKSKRSRESSVGQQIGSTREGENLFVLKVQAFLKDALVIFSDFDEAHDLFKEESTDVLQN